MCHNYSFAPSELADLPLSHPRLTPWAVFYRRFAAGGRFPFVENLVKGVEGAFLDQVVDSLGEINRLICPIYPMQYDIIHI